jgi:hypothetical protein
VIKEPTQCRYGYWGCRYGVWLLWLLLTQLAL